MEAADPEGQHRSVLPESVLAAFRKIAGKDNVLSSPAELLLYAYDAAIDRAVPSAVVLPETTGQVSAVVKICAQYKIPFVARGAATNLCGATIPCRGPWCWPLRG